MTRSGGDIASQVLEVVAAWTAGIVARKRLVDRKRLQDAGEPCRDDRRAGRGRRVHRQAGARWQQTCAASRSNGPKHVGRNERDTHPGVAAPNAVLHVGQRVKRNADEREIDRQHEMALDVILKEPDAARAEQHDERCRRRAPRAGRRGSSRGEWSKSPVSR